MNLKLFDVLSDVDLLNTLRDAVRAERHATATLIALLMEVDRRRLYLAEGYSSLFTYCTQALHLSEHAAYGRIEAARAARRFPVILERLANGELTLTSVCLLARHLTPENHLDALRRSAHKAKREIEQVVAELRPMPDVAPALRRLPAPKLATAPVTPTVTAGALPMSTADTPRPAVALPPRRAGVKALAPERFKLQLTIGRATYDKLRRIQDLLRHAVPDGNLETIVDKALTLLVDHVVRTKCAAAKRPRGVASVSHTTRHIPAAVRRAVWERDAGRCAFVGPGGRCRETAFLEFHHVHPFAHGGLSTVDNLELRCRAHNMFEEERRLLDLPVTGSH